MSSTEPRYAVTKTKTTAPSEEEAQNIARSLVEEKLAACATLMPVRSIYS